MREDRKVYDCVRLESCLISISYLKSTINGGTRDETARDTYVNIVIALLGTVRMRLTERPL